MTTAAAPPRTLLDFLQRTATFFEGRGIDGARLDAELLLGEVLGMTRVQLYTNFEQPLGEKEVDAFRDLVRRRAAREPVAYILGHREFWTLDLVVDRRVLIPRPETELLVESAVDALKKRGVSGDAPKKRGDAEDARDDDTAANGAATLRMADVGTGSGAIAIAVATEVPALRVLATDRSEAALEIAPHNAQKHGVADRIEFRSGDGCAALAGSGPFDVIVSNPPYIRSGEMASLPPEVKDWEPRWALESGADGMDVTGPLVDDAFDLLLPGGSLFVEVGTQAALVRERFARRGYEGVTVKRDLAGIERVVAGRRPDARTS